MACRIYQRGLMKRKYVNLKNILLFGAVLSSIFCLSAYAKDLNCITRAEADYDVPAGLLNVMAAYEAKRNQPVANKLYGPMQLHSVVIPMAAEGIHSTEHEIKYNDCQNYRAAAWLLMNSFGGNLYSDIFNAVNNYYYGFGKQSYGVITLKIKDMYQHEKR
ncbi:type IV pilus biogenesis protein PilT (plasmid) [Yersinia pseudotuberculosis IP 31758]|uniref:Type IV pilus biogenesis protein PilT n=2 Tax=Yersinia TaxID=629 RepID=A0A0U1QT98_YERP3|nr:type IV pilus biogenesis protein PilT [Yersinia pseudotuberculosis IP 31758]